MKKITENEQALPTLPDVLEAHRRISSYLQPTPLRRYPSLDRLVGTEVWVKHENHQPTGAFKVRGGINLISQLPDGERRAGVITASTGNHGQSIAYAAHLFGVPAIVCVPKGANPIKIAAIRDFQGEIVIHGRDFDAAREHAEGLARSTGSRYVHAGNEPPLIAGVATRTLEILQEMPRVDVIIAPVGGGSGAAGACTVAKALQPHIEIIGVQSKEAPAAFRSWKNRELLEDTMHTFAEGLATRVPFELTQQILWAGLDDFILVTDNQIRRAVVLMIETTRTLVEPAGAAALAAALKIQRRLTGKRVAIICSGGNVSPAQLQAVLTKG